MKFIKKHGRVYVSWDQDSLTWKQVRKVNQDMIDQNLVYELDERDYQRWKQANSKKWVFCNG
jgi:hypothetical protein